MKEQNQEAQIGEILRSPSLSRYEPVLMQKSTRHITSVYTILFGSVYVENPLLVIYNEISPVFVSFYINRKYLNCYYSCPVLHLLENSLLLRAVTKKIPKRKFPHFSYRSKPITPLQNLHASTGFLKYFGLFHFQSNKKGDTHHSSKIITFDSILKYNGHK